MALKHTNKPLHRRAILALLVYLRRSRLQRSIIKIFVFLHNWSYHAISFFAADGNTHPKHNIIRYHEFFTENVNPDDRVLDIGSSTGMLSYQLAQHAHEVVGIEMHAGRFHTAQQRYKEQPNLSFVFGDVNSYSFSQTFDMAVLSNVLEHVDERVALLSKLHDLAPRLLIRVPLLTRDWITVYKKQQEFEYRLDDTHYTEYTLNQLKEELAAAGYQLTRYTINFGELYADCERAQ